MDNFNSIRSEHSFCNGKATMREEVLKMMAAEKAALKGAQGSLVRDLMRKVENLEVEITDRSAWISTKVRKPDEEYKAWRAAGHPDNPQFIVFIRYAQLSTCLDYDGERWLDDFGDTYDVTHWMNMPEIPEEEKE